jgi:hypothetical protein
VSKLKWLAPVATTFPLVANSHARIHPRCSECGKAYCTLECKCVAYTKTCPSVTLLHHWSRIKLGNFTLQLSLIADVGCVHNQCLVIVNASRRESVARSESTHCPVQLLRVTEPTSFIEQVLQIYETPIRCVEFILNVVNNHRARTESPLSPNKRQRLSSPTYDSQVDDLSYEDWRRFDELEKHKGSPVSMQSSKPFAVGESSQENDAFPVRVAHISSISASAKLLSKYRTFCTPIV